MDSTKITDGNDDLWIFVSHSTKDFEKVRKLRNMMEEIGMRPLLFYLKCLKDKPEVSLQVPPHDLPNPPH